MPKTRQLRSAAALHIFSPTAILPKGPLDRSSTKRMTALTAPSCRVWLGLHGFLETANPPLHALDE